MANFFGSGHSEGAPRSRRFIELVLTACAVAFCPLSMWLVDPQVIAEGETTWLLTTGVLGVGALLILSLIHI